MSGGKEERRQKEAEARMADYLARPANEVFDDSRATRGRLTRHFHSLFGTKREQKVKRRGLAG